MPTFTKTVMNAPASARAEAGESFPPRSLSRLWRVTAADAYDSVVTNAISACLRDMVLAETPEWEAAIAKDASAAIGIALRMHHRGDHHHGFDLAMTALTVCAAEENAAACLVAAHIIRNLPASGPAEARIATSWLVRAFLSALVKASDAEVSS